MKPDMQEKVQRGYIATQMIHKGMNNEHKYGVAYILTPSFAELEKIMLMKEYWT